MSALTDPRERTVTLLGRADFDAPGTLDELVPLVYDELRAMARRQLRRERPDHTLQTTGLVHEAYLKLAGDDGVTARGRAYFFGAAARALRQVLVEHARRRDGLKRGGDLSFVTLDGREGTVDDFAEELVAIDDALATMGAEHPRLVRVVECRYFGGLTVEETAGALGISPRTVKYDWAMARAWLWEALGGAGDTGPAG